MQQLRWALAAVFLVAFCWIAIANWILLLRWLLYKKRGSTIPFLGGAFGVAAVLATPIKDFLWLWWVPLIVDPASLPMVLLIPYSYVCHLRRRGGR
jgi:hypothetical protein